MNKRYASRRRFLQQLAGLGTTLALHPKLLLGQNRTPIKRRIPSTNSTLPVIGMGSWLTFDIGNNAAALATRIKVLQAFFEQGGGMIDSSPMYGSSEAVIGQCLQQLQHTKTLFSATKVWTYGQAAGVKQMQRSLGLWKQPTFDLMQIHNMLDWEVHYETLAQWKTEGRIRYIGITTSHGRRHSAIEQALTNKAFDFVQFTYNILDREAENRLLPLALERNIAVIINRPFRGGDLFTLFDKKPLPRWAADIDCHNWAQFLLKFIVSHPGVSCAIPATSQVTHMHENMGAGIGRLPDTAMRKRMLSYVHSL